MDRERGEAILVTSRVSPANYAACLRPVSQRGIHTIVASGQKTSPALVSRYCDEPIVVPSPWDDLVAYKDALVAIAARPDVQTIVPCHPSDSYVLAKYWDEFVEHVNPLVPPMKTVRSVHDRLQLFQAAKEAGVPVPETWSIDEIDNWNRELIIKSRYNIHVDEYIEGLSPQDCGTVKNIEYIGSDEVPDIDTIREEMMHTPIVQECVPKADEYLFGALYDHGEPVATFQHKQIRGATYAGGGGSYRESIYDPELETVGRKLLNHLDWHGLACIEYMEDANTGEFKLTEINPRVWRSMAFAIRAGAEFPYYYWLLATGQSQKIDPEYRVGIGGHLLYGELTYLYSILRETNPNVERPAFRAALFEMLSSCYDQPHFDHRLFDDPLPFLRGVANTVPILRNVSISSKVRPLADSIGGSTELERTSSDLYNP